MTAVRLMMYNISGYLRGLIRGRYETEGKSMDRNKIWDLYAPFYNGVMKRNQGIYDKNCRRIRRVIAGRRVLELAAGTGLVSRQVAASAASYIATDLSEKMMEQAMKGEFPEQLSFMRADAAELPFEDGSFDAVIISNALHIIPKPERVLAEARRVLVPNGIFIAPNFIHRDSGVLNRAVIAAFAALGIGLETRWNADGFVSFLEENGFRVVNKAVSPAMIPMIYTESQRKP